ncbi:MAG: hypothetical protein QM736_08565 [Vicinamibacterales bacterium]
MAEESHSLSGPAIGIVSSRPATMPNIAALGSFINAKPTPQMIPTINAESACARV